MSRYANQFWKLILFVFAGILLGSLVGCDSSPTSSPVVTTPPLPPGTPGSSEPPPTAPDRDPAGEGMVGPGTGKLKWVAADSAPGKYNAFSRDGTLDQGGPDDPWLMVMTRTRSENIDKLQAATTKASSDSKYFAEFRILSTTPVTIDTAEGFEILSQGKLIETGTMTTIYTVVLYPTPTTYFVIRGQTPQADETQWLTEFRAMANGWKKLR